MLESSYKATINFVIFMIVLLCLGLLIYVFEGENFKINMHNAGVGLENFEEYLQTEGEISKKDKLKLEMILDDINGDFIVEEFIIGNDNRSVIIKVTQSNKNTFGGTIRSDKVYKEIQIEK